MANHPPAGPRLLWTFGTLLLTTSVWGLAGWIARDTSPSRIELTNCLFALALIVSYVVLWSLRVTWTRGRSRQATFQAVAATLVLLVLVLILEAPAFLGLVDYSRLWESLTAEWRGPARNFDVDLELGYRRCPNLHMVGYCTGDIAGGWNMPRQYSRPLEFTYNSQGFRSRIEYTTADVVTLGDSYIEGWYVSDGETCSDRLAELTGLTVANLAQSGFGTLQELHMLQRHGLRLSPRLVVWFFYEGNDLYNDQDFEDLLAYFQEVGGSVDDLRRRLGYERTSFRQASFTINAFTGLRRACDWLVPNNMPYFGWYRDERGTRHKMLFYSECMSELSDWELERFEKTKESIATGKSLCDQQEARLLVCYIPTKFRVYGEFCEFSDSSPCRQWRPWSLLERLSGFCSEAGVPFLDLTPPMREAARTGRLLYGPADTHWDREGHTLVAKLLEQKCREYGLAELEY